MEQFICPHCGAPIVPEDYFCPQCGKKLKDKPPSTSVLAQIGVYLLSIFLPPFGLWPAVKYLRQSDEKSKRIGIAAVLLTALSLVVTVYLTIGIAGSINNTINSLNGIGY